MLSVDWFNFTSANEARSALRQVSLVVLYFLYIHLFFKIVHFHKVGCTCKFAFFSLYRFAFLILTIKIAKDASWSIGVVGSAIRCCRCSKVQHTWSIRIQIRTLSKTTILVMRWNVWISFRIAILQISSCNSLKSVFVCLFVCFSFYFDDILVSRWSLNDMTIRCLLVGYSLVLGKLKNWKKYISVCLTIFVLFSK